MIYYGIDAGSSGGLARIVDENIKLWSFEDHTIPEMVGLFHLVFQDQDLSAARKVMLEKLQPLPSFLRGGRASWVLAQSYATIKTLLSVHNMAYEEVRPAIWQKEFGLVVKKSKKRIDKKKLNREKAQALFPGIMGITLATSDALLIAEYNRRTHK